MRKPVIAGNWKMYKLHDEAVNTALELKALVATANHCEVVIAPVFTAVKTVCDRLEGLQYQGRRSELFNRDRTSAHTGEVCADMIKDVGAHVIIGHSERRQFYGDTDDSVNSKTKAGLGFGLTAIVCVGGSAGTGKSGMRKMSLTINSKAVLRV